jgi:hypothetical protein
MSLDQNAFDIATLKAVPVLTRESFAEQVGLTAPTVYSMCDRGYLPTVHFGRRVFINVEVLRRQCAEKAF